ncbi:protocatechuate 3,4-dioxygenase subunit alpha [Prescottella equi]|uniref:Protocatechuate 3,4-dioxygenase, alpha subunit n=1 Tax=Prescottella equi ATCC 33707 TaxID=525370 RepID=E9T399_RHOHA|nr:protocatechuate 3,4-dioxygenase subunit alpha [Prescottella equi]EGD23323.1 protocatechuate 3,4-dioxygenase, alpha subunit [Prescottella equi ATCC 33707]NKS32530.1 protocatechuate 3,4-dioxygenase subunit alpha [Prescottella equi]BCN45157.1 protocatechuate 3,4-dioxygenase subunit alpha [Prescottella equi]BCN84797.1 protocatechuate 3,4-dioxygenase subunit alpha [Prescottella equi]
MTDTAPQHTAPLYSVTPGDFTTAPFGVTPSQTVGPYWHIGLPWADGPDVVAPGTPERITLRITVIDGNRVPVADAMVETWQADAVGRFAHPDDPRGAAAPTPAGFRGFGRAGADETGTAVIHTVKPGALPAENDTVEAPHVNLGIFARGMLERLYTRLYFPEDTQAHTGDPVLLALPESQRTKLIASRTDDGYSLTVYVQDSDPDGVETPFFEL